jgi:hypothetical protein
MRQKVIFQLVHDVWQERARFEVRERRMLLSEDATEVLRHFESLSPHY